jgi:hypothetical protein
VKSYNLINPEQAHQAIAKIWLEVKNNLMAGRRMVLVLQDYDEALTVQQRRFYHGYILIEIAEQAQPQGVKYPMKVWKEYFREKYLGDEVQTSIDPMTGATKKDVVRVSSESLGVKGYNELIEKVTAFAVTDLGVVFDKTMQEWGEQ